MLMEKSEVYGPLLDFEDAYGVALDYVQNELRLRDGITQALDISDAWLFRTTVWCETEPIPIWISVEKKSEEIDLFPSENLCLFADAEELELPDNE